MSRSFRVLAIHRHSRRRTAADKRAAARPVVDISAAACRSRTMVDEVAEDSRLAVDMSLVYMWLGKERLVADTRRADSLAADNWAEDNSAVDSWVVDNWVADSSADYSTPDNLAEDSSKDNCWAAYG